MTETESYQSSECVRESKKALLVAIRPGDEFWFPKSVIQEESEIQGWVIPGNL